MIKKNNNEFELWRSKIYKNRTKGTVVLGDQNSKNNRQEKTEKGRRKRGTESGSTKRTYKWIKEGSTIVGKGTEICVTNTVTTGL